MRSATALREVASLARNAPGVASAVLHHLLLLLPQACVRGWLLWVETSRAVVPALPAACGVGRAKYEGLPARPTEWPPAG